MNTTEFLMIASAIVPERDAVVFNGKRYSFELLQERVNRLANALSDLGVAPGDRIAAMQTNCNHLIELYFAVAQLDAIYVPINFRAKEDELATMVRIVEPSFLFLGERYLPLVAGADLPDQRIVMLDAPAAGGRHNYEDLLQSAEPDQMHFPEDDEDATTVIMFTSGTTSIPKGVQLTHDSFGTFLLTNVTPADPDVEETNLLTVPMYHVAGTPGGARGGVRRSHLGCDAPVRSRRMDGSGGHAPGQPRHAGAHHAETRDGSPTFP